MSRHAVSFLEIKSLDEEQRVISGWASRPEVDRQGDVVEPGGLQPLRGTVNLLLDHDHKRAVGVLTDVRPSAEGVRFTAKMAKILTPGPLKELCDDAWSMVRASLRSAVSIGFKPIESEPLTGGGLRFKKWSLLELSLVSVPAAPGATIDTIKSLDRSLRLKNVGKGHRVVRLDGPLPLSHPDVSLEEFHRRLDARIARKQL